MTIYFDYNATAPVRRVVIQAITEGLQLLGNPSSVHGHGRQVRKRVETAREDIARNLGVEAIDITFTSGATEANNNVILGHPASCVMASAIEHPSVLEAIKQGNKKGKRLPVGKNGIVECDALEKALKETAEKTLVSIMAVNNETGVIQPIADIAALCRQYGAELHCDAVQALGKLPLKPIADNADYVSLSAHKIGGPMGVGALIYDHHHTLAKQISGGGQERRRRAGTENVSGIIGFAAAVQEASRESNEKPAQWREWQRQIETRIHAITDKAIIVGENVSRVSQTLQIILPEVPSQKQLMFMDINGISVSSGSACSSGSVQPSHVLSAQGYGDLADNALRISWGHDTRADDIDAFITVWEKMAKSFYKE